MLMIISPAKKLDMKRVLRGACPTMADYLHDSALLVTLLQNMNSSAIASLMKLSLPLADLNQRRYQCWHRPFTQENSTHALAANTLKRFKPNVLKVRSLPLYLKNTVMGYTRLLAFMPNAPVA